MSDIPVCNCQQRGPKESCPVHASKPKHPGGRPLKFQSLKELTDIADKYFAETPEAEWTTTGLALALDTTRELLMDYQNKDEFSDTIKKYKLKVHMAYEKDLRKMGRSGDIFALKNFGWRDQIHTDITTKGKPVSSLLSGDGVRSNNSDQEDQ